MSRLTDLLLGLHGPAAYTAIGLLAAAEASAFIGLFVPGELAVLLGGVLAFQGKVSFPTMAAVSSAGAIAGDSVGYFIGKRFGPRLRASRLGRIVGATRWERATRFLERRGAGAVIIGRFTAALRVLVPGLAGMTRMPYGRFLAANIAGGIVWATGFTAAGFAAGGAWRQVERMAGRASLVLLALLVVVGSSVWAVRAATRHAEALRSVARRFGDVPVVRSVRRRLAPQLDFVAGRFDARAATGLRLTAGLAAVGLLGWFFGIIVEDVLGRNESVRFDLPLAQALARHTSPWLTATMKVVTVLGSTAAVVAIGFVAAAAWRILRRDWFAAQLLGITLAGSAAVKQLVKVMVGRPRPPVAHLVAASGWTFPSGHATSAAALWFGLATLAGQVWPSWKARARAWSVAAAIAVLVAASRLVLGVHYLTDVVAGLLLGSLSLAVTTTALTARGPDRGPRSRPRAPG